MEVYIELNPWTEMNASPPPVVTSPGPKNPVREKPTDQNWSALEMHMWLWRIRTEQEHTAGSEGAGGRLHGVWRQGSRF